MKLIPNNYLRDSDTTITVQGETNLFPPDRMTNNKLKEVTRFDGKIEIDFGSPREVEYFSLKTTAPLGTLKAGTTSAVSDFSLPVTALNDGSIKVFKLDSPQTYQYWAFETLVSTPYVNGTDGDLDNPSDDYSSASTFIPMSSDDSGSRLQIGSYIWETGYTAGINSMVAGFSGSSYGSVTYRNSEPIVNFAASSFDGLQTVTLPKNASGDTLGGSFPAAYTEASFRYAFENTSNTLIYDQEGNAYKNAFGLSNLVLTRDLKTGPAGSDTPEVDFEFYMNYIFLGKAIDLPRISPNQVTTKTRNDIIDFSTAGTYEATAGIRYQTFSSTFPTPEYEQFKELDDYLESFDRVNANILFIWPDNEELAERFPPIFGVIGDDAYLQRRNQFRYYPFTFSFREVK